MTVPPGRLLISIKFLIFSCIGLAVLSCSESRGKEEKKLVAKETLFTLLDSNTTGFNFVNRVRNEKEFNIFKYRNFYNGAGVGIGDINNDGLSDVFLTSNMEENKLFLNKGDFKFEDITASSGTGGKKAWSTGVTMVDINND